MRIAAFSILALGSVACGVASTSPEPDAVSGADNLGAARAVCTEATRPQILAAALKSPLQPPRGVAGLDLAGGDDWAGLPQSAVEQALCTGTLIPDEDPKATTDFYHWGGTPEDSPLTLGFDKTTDKLAYWTVGRGYEGKIDFRSRAGSRFGNHTYSIAISGAILRDGAPFLIDWSNQAAREEAGTELHDGVIATFAPELASEQTNCRVSQRCLIALQPDGKLFFGVRDVRFYFVLAAFAAGPAESTPAFFYGFPERPQIHPPPRSKDLTALPR
jgi:hypothetical protein